MSRHPLARILLGAGLAVAAAGCSQHAGSEARADQANDDRNRVAQQSAPDARPGDPFAAQGVQTTRRDAGAARSASDTRSRAVERPAPPREVTVPAGVQVAVRLDAAVSSASASSGQRIQGELAAPLAAGSEVVAPVGTPVEATVATVVPSGRLGGT